MYSSELEELIDAVLADEEISDVEMKVLRRRAQEEGKDPDEVEVVVRGRMAKLKKQKSATSMAPPPVPEAAPAQRPSSKYGEVNKCPNCGAIVKAGSVKCDTCGYFFRGITANSSVERLSQLIQEANDRNPTNIITEQLGMSKRITTIAAIITNFPVPTTKEDLLEFILFLQPKASINRFKATMDEVRFVSAYKTKYQECLNKAKLYFSDDPMFKDIIPKKKKGLFGALFE